jgi:hypothetical protein
MRQGGKRGGRREIKRGRIKKAEGGELKREILGMALESDRLKHCSAFISSRA